MFSVVPKVLWEKSVDVDSLNRILLATRTLVVVHRAAGRVLLIETGCGTKWQPDRADRFAIKHDPHAVAQGLAKLGASPDDVTDVVITHLHFDHNGGLTYWYDQPGGPTRLHFPKANHWIHRRHWEHAQNPHIKDQVSFLEEDFASLEEAGVLRFVEDGQPGGPLPGLTWIVTQGHTPCQLHPRFSAEGQSLLFVGDIVPTVAHLRLAWIMAYDLLPMTTIAEKKRFTGWGIEDGLVLAFPHDLAQSAVRISGCVERPIVTEPVDLAL